LQPRLREPLPLAPLLVILRTYGELRRLVPGLSALGTEELEQALAASLLEDDLAGVRRLVESHATLMAHCLKRRTLPAGAGESEEEDVTSPQGDDGGDGPLDELSARLQAAIDAHAELDLTYADTQGKVTHRRVRPLHLDRRWGRRYLLAHCQLRDEDRHFRLDRIVQVTESA
jgi:predicted DNA-binding transcriptional regulator YafY